MICILRGIKRVDYVSKKDNERKQGIELHCERKPYPSEPFTPGSDVVFTEYLPFTDQSAALCNSVLQFPIMSEIDLVYIQNGKYSNLVDVHLSK